MKILLLSALPGVAALILWSVIDLENFVLFAVLGATIFPASLGHIGGSNIALVDVLLVVAVFAWLVTSSLGQSPDPLFRRNPLLLPAVLFTAWNTISIAWSIHPSKTFAFSIQLTELTIVFPLAFATFPTSIEKLRRALLWLIGLTSILSIVALVVVARNSAAQNTSELMAGYNKNALGSFCGAAVVLAYALFIAAPGRRERMLLLLAMAVNAGGLTASNSRGALVGAGLGVVVVALLLGHHRLLAIMLASAVALGYILVAAPAHTLLASAAGGYSSSSVRHWLWVDTLTKIEANPWFGTGGRTFFLVLPQLYGFVAIDPDNLFLLTWAELGIPGLLLIGFLFVRYFALLLRLRSLKRETAALGVGAGGVVMSLLLHFQVDVGWSRGETTLEFVMLGVMLAVARIDDRAPAARTHMRSSLAMPAAQRVAGSI